MEACNAKELCAVTENDDLIKALETRFGRIHARQRLGIETDHEAQVFGQGRNFFHVENWYSAHGVIRSALRVAGLYKRGLRNAERVELRCNEVRLADLPPSFDGFVILHISDMHADMNAGAMRRVIELLDGLRYDICVMTGDFRGKTFGPFDTALSEMARVRAHLSGPVFGVLRNHDTIRMVPELEKIGIRMLLNEMEAIERGNERI